MLNLRADRWDPSYGASIEIEDLAEPIPEVIFGVEDSEWVAHSPESTDERVRCAFIDGVRRIDMRIFAEQNGQSFPVLAGSWAVGAAWSSSEGKSSCIDSVEVGRELIVSGGLDPESIKVRIGHMEMLFRGFSTPEASLIAPQNLLQAHMREAEGSLARELYRSGRADLLVIDGPLPFLFMKGPVIGFIKRQNKMYLQGEKSRILSTLRPGERTPLFQIGEGAKARYSWYTRIASGRDFDGFMTGIVRCEISPEVGISEAVRVANQATGLFPRFASASWHDPRAPQNLYPVGQLENTLRHRLGDAQLLRRSLEATLYRRLSAAPEQE